MLCRACRSMRNNGRDRIRVAKDGHYGLSRGYRCVEWRMRSVDWQTFRQLDTGRKGVLSSGKASNTAWTVLRRIVLKWFEGGAGGLQVYKSVVAPLRDAVKNIPLPPIGTQNGDHVTAQPTREALMRLHAFVFCTLSSTATAVSSHWIRKMHV